MKKTRNKIGIVVAMILLAGVFTGCNKEKQEASKGKEIHLNIALQPDPGFGPGYLLRDKGWLEEELKEQNVKIKFTEFESGPPENESFAAGQQDIGVMGNVPALTGIASGQNRSIIGISFNGEKTLATLVSADSKITDIGGLKGKKVGLVVGSIAQNLLDEQLKHAGLSLTDVQLVNLSLGELAVALESHQVDAVTTWTPNITKLTNSQNARILADGTGIFLGERVIVANADYVKKYPEIVDVFIEQYQRAAKEIQDHSNEFAKDYAEQFGLSSEELEQVLSNINFQITIEKKDGEDLQKTADFLYEGGVITKKLSVEEYIDYDIVKGE